MRQRRHYNLMIVEDNPGDAVLIKDAFSSKSNISSVNVFSDGETAISFLKSDCLREPERRPDLILLDLNLPGGNGRDILKQIKSNEKFKFIPVVVLTSSDHEEDLKTVYSEGANAYVRKPIDADHFFNVIGEIQSF